jgi:hypothetical protein
MSEDTEKLDQLRLFTDRQDAEAQLHWNRNSYFLVVMSILILAFSQQAISNAYQLSLFRKLVAFLGAILSIIWLLIRHCPTLDALKLFPVFPQLFLNMQRQNPQL